MVSFRFPFSFPQRQKHTPPIYSFSSSATSRPFFATTAAVYFAAGAASVAGVAAATHNSTNQAHPFLQNALNLFFANRSLPLWSSLSLNYTSSSVVDSKTQLQFFKKFKPSLGILGVFLVTLLSSSAASPAWITIQFVAGFVLVGLPCWVLDDLCVNENELCAICSNPKK
ncbi:hypothetical protein PRUPE_8G240000 [Prunus persica]|uniref:Uncharacterized protein n=1 Tax=Prunus persica TaxID=3760 RepID=A0A251N2M1_PRUPE|nr:hypothetical protein PRUPE_8G240000 [Prunus persica]